MNLSNFFSIKPKPVEILFFTRHLATMIKAGITIDDALETLAEQTKSSAFKKIIESVLADVKNGQTLSKALNKHPKAFDQFYVSLIQVSEESGSLDDNLEFIAKQLAKNYNLIKKIKAAMLYPMIIFSVMTIMGGFVSFFILPLLVSFFEAFGDNLPLSTQILLFIANTFKNHGLIIAITAVSLFTLFQYIIRLNKVKPYWHKFLLKLPIIGKFIINTQVAQFSRNFGILIKSGLPIAKSLDVTSQTLNNITFRNHVNRLSSSLSRGKNIADTMENGQYKEFPTLVSKMIAIGEKTGKLDESLLYLGEFYEDEIDDFSKNLTTLLEPVLLVIIGIAVGFVALAIITPIYELTSSFSK